MTDTRLGLIALILTVLSLGYVLAPAIENGASNFKTFLELSHSFGQCDGVGDPRCKYGR